MTRNRLFTCGALVAVLGMSFAGCKKKEGEETPAEEAAKPEDTKAAEAPKPDEAPKEEPKPADEAVAGDSIVVIATHNPAKPADPVMVKLPKFEVKNVSFEDPNNLEGATAELTIDLSEIDSGDAKRDGHLKTPDFMDVEKFATADIKIKDVKKDGEGYKANAEVTAHGVTSTMPVAFTVKETTEDSVTIEGEHDFKRADFKIHEANQAPVSEELKIKINLTLKKA